MKKCDKREIQQVNHDIKSFIKLIERERVSRRIACRTLTGANKLAKALLDAGANIDHLKVFQYHYACRTENYTIQHEVDLPIIEVDMHFNKHGTQTHIQKIKKVLKAHNKEIVSINLGL